MSIRRIYMDNAATSFPKPPAVLEAMNRYATEIGASAGRGAYREAIESAAVLISECRQRLQKLFNGERAEHFIFTLNCSDALNTALKGLVLYQLKQGKKPHCICTRIDHNSVLRPLNAMEETGLDHPDAGCRSIRAPAWWIPRISARRSGRKRALIAVTHAIQRDRHAAADPQDRRDRPRARHSARAWMRRSRPGMCRSTCRPTGSICSPCPGTRACSGPWARACSTSARASRSSCCRCSEGGTGSISEQPRQPDFMPDRFESGSHNAIGIAGLSEGVQWLLDRGPQKMLAHDRELMATFIEGISVVEIPGLRYFGPQGVANRVGVFSVRMEGFTPHELSQGPGEPLRHPHPAGHPLCPAGARGHRHPRYAAAPRGSASGRSCRPADVNYATDCLADVMICRTEGRASAASR